MGKQVDPISKVVSCHLAWQERQVVQKFLIAGLPAERTP